MDLGRLVCYQPNSRRATFTSIHDADFVSGGRIQAGVAHLQRTIIKRLSPMPPGHRPIGTRIANETDEARFQESRICRRAGAAHEMRRLFGITDSVVEAARARVSPIHNLFEAREP